MALPSPNFHNRGTELLDDEHYGSPKMGDASSVVGKMVKDFLATRDAELGSRADIVFDQLSVEGNGKGVCG